jgi:hypothetical protein
MTPDLSEVQIVYEATMGALSGIRRILLLISGLLGLFLFNIFTFYFCWDYARVEARKGVLETLEESHQEHKFYLGSQPLDDDLKAKAEKEIESISKDLADRAYEVPLVKMRVSASDFSVALLMLATALFLWLLFFQRKFGACLRQLAKLRGWEVVISALQYHFLLVGSNASAEGRRATQGLIYGIPFVGSLQIITDVVDLGRWFQDKIQKLAFNNNDFVLRMVIRLGIDVGLVVTLTILANRCYREYKKIEEELTEHLTIDAP